MRGIWLSLGCYAAYALSDALIKALHGSLPLFQVTFTGAAWSLLALPFLRQVSHSWRDTVRIHQPSMWLLRAVAGGLCNLMAVVAFTHLPMAEALSLIFLMPLFVTLLSRFWLGEHVSRLSWVAVALGFLGVLTILRPGLRPLGIGQAAALACGLLGATGVVALRRSGAHESKFTLYSAGAVGAVVINGALMGTHWVPSTFHQQMLVAGYGLLVGAAGLLIMLAMRASSASRLAPIQYSQMVWAVGLGWWLFQDHLDAFTWVGMGLILVGGLLSTRWGQLQLQRWIPVQSAPHRDTIGTPGAP